MGKLETRCIVLAAASMIQVGYPISATVAEPICIAFTIPGKFGCIVFWWYK